MPWAEGESLPEPMLLLSRHSESFAFAIEGSPSFPSDGPDRWSWRSDNWVREHVAGGFTCHGAKRFAPQT